MKRNIIYICIALIFSAAGASAFELGVGTALRVGAKAVKAARGISDKEEILLGREMGANLCARYGLYDDENLMKYVNLVGRALAANSGRTNIKYYFAVLNTDTVNAFAAPGGYVFITKGALAAIRDEAELAGVLAHEIAHISQRHIAREIQKANMVDAGTDLAVSNSDNQYLMGQLAGFGSNILFKGYSRSDEKEADEKGYEIAAKTGYDSKGLERFVEILAQRVGSDTSFSTLFKTHPNPNERLGLLRDKGNSGEGAVNAERYAASVKL